LIKDTGVSIAWVTPFRWPMVIVSGWPSLPNWCKLCNSVGKYVVNPATWLIFTRAAIGVLHPPPSPASRGKKPLAIVVVLERHAHLLQVVDALRSPSCFARRLNGGQEQLYEHANDRNNDE
jgi:hypothetical protein